MEAKDGRDRQVNCVVQTADAQSHEVLEMDDIGLDLFNEFSEDTFGLRIAVGTIQRIPLKGVPIEELDSQTVSVLGVDIPIGTVQVFQTAKHEHVMVSGLSVGELVAQDCSPRHFVGGELMDHVQNAH
jgi:hypothetical protein